MTIDVKVLIYSKGGLNKAVALLHSVNDGGCCRTIKLVRQAVAANSKIAKNGVIVSRQARFGCQLSHARCPIEFCNSHDEL